MARSEFRYNPKRKHYTYIFGEKRIFKNNKLTIVYKYLLLTSKSKRKKKRRNGTYKEYDNVKLYQHPNPNKTNNQYVIPKVGYDNEESFSDTKQNWKFHPYDRRKIKKIRKGKWKQ